MDKRPNILFILTDDQRFDMIHSLGAERLKTPNLDALAARGCAFTQAHIPSGTSGAVCMPSRAMIHSGRTLFHLENQGEAIPPEHITLGETLRQGGYRAFGCGKWHNGPAAFARSFSEGDNIFFGGMWDHWNVPLNRYDPTGEYDNEINFVANFFEDNAPLRVHCDKFEPGRHSSELLTDTAISALDRLDGEDPFFLYLAYLAPHDPRTMPEEYRRMYNPEDIELPPNFQTTHFDFGVHTIRDEVLAAYPRDEREIRRHIAEYYAMITHLDHQIGRVMEALKRKNLLDNTIIVMAGDNGLAVGQHGLMGKQNHYEHSIRVPFLMAGPGIPAGQKINRYVYLMDIYPTLCDLVNLPIPDLVEGLSFAPMFRDPNHTTRRALYFGYAELIRSVKDERFKLIEYRNFAHRHQLFDLENDPWETRDLIDDPAYQGQVERLLRLREEFRAQWEDSGHPMSRAYWEGQ